MRSVILFFSVILCKSLGRNLLTNTGTNQPDDSAAQALVCRLVKYGTMYRP